MDTKKKRGGRLINLIGIRFGRLTVQKRVQGVKVRPNGLAPQWLAICDCGKTRVVTRRILVDNPRRCGSTPSCGCANRSGPIKFKSGQQIGHLTLVRYVGKKKGAATWVARCRCGKEIEIHPTAERFRQECRVCAGYDLEFGGEILSRLEWAKRLGITRQALHNRLKLYPLEVALSGSKGEKLKAAHE